MSQMTPIEPLDFRPPVPPYSGPVDSVQVEMIGVDQLRIDHDYQRSLTEKSRRTIGHIAREFTWARFGVLTVARTGQVYAVVDGQHRAIAAASIGIARLPCLVLQAGKAGQARDFVGINATRTKITPVDTFRAACVAGDPQAVELREILDQLGIALTNMPLREQRGRETRAISTLQRILTKRGRGQTYTLLELLTDAGDDPDYLTAFAITTTDILLDLVLQVGGDLDQLLKILKSTHFDELRADAARATKMLGGTPTKTGVAMLARAWNKSNPQQKVRV